MLAKLPFDHKVSPPSSLHFDEGRITIGPVLAARILAELNYAGQRPTTAPHVAFLADHMRRGTFRAGSQIAFARQGARYVLVNGQHRLKAVIESGSEVDFQLLVTDYQEDTELAAIYYTFDRGSRARSDAEVLASVGIADAFGLSKTITRALFQAHPLLSSNFARSHFTADPVGRNDDLRLAFLTPWWPIAARFEGLIEGALTWVRKRLSNAQGVASGVILIKHQPEIAERFWRGLSDDDGLQKGDPRKALLNDLAAREWSRKSTDGCYAISTAWNAFYEGRQLNLVKIGANAKLRFAGTPVGRGR